MSHTTLQMEHRLKGQQFGKCKPAPRFDASAIPSLKSINRVGGPQVKLINISRSGLLMESPEHMLPGSNISLRLVTAEVVYSIKGRVTRCGTSSTNSKLFQSGIAFDEEFTLLPPGTNS
jgi:hypothetical protein